MPVLGGLLRSLRLERGWMQREAAENTGVSDRLIRKAEAGEPIELKSIAMLAQLYSTPERPLTPKDLLAEPLRSRGNAAESARYESLLRRWFQEVWNDGRLEAIEELASPDCVLHADGTTLNGPVEVRQRTEAIRAAFSDINITVENVRVHEDWVISRWQVSMTNTGPWMEMPPTLQRITVRGSTWMRVDKNGKLSEGWDYWEQHQATDAVRRQQPSAAKNRVVRKKPSGRD